MMQSEFENLLGHSVDYSEYEKIETVYMCFEKMSKQEIADLYKRDSQFLTTKLYNYVLDIDKERTVRIAETDKLRSCINELKSQVLDERKEANMMIDTSVKLAKININLKMRLEELETQLHQYKTLFSDIEKNMTVDLYKTLLGDME